MRTPRKEELTELLGKEEVVLVSQRTSIKEGLRVYLPMIFPKTHHFMNQQTPAAIENTSFHDILPDMFCLSKYH